MENPKQDSAPLQGIGLILIAAILGGIFWFQNPLTSSRPQAPESLPLLSSATEDVQARLWEDPFQAIVHHQTQEHKPGGMTTSLNQKHSFNSLAKKIREISRPPDHIVNILLVMMDGSPYVEGTESRLRTRYAVLAGLNVAGFVPENAEHVGYVEMLSRSPDHRSYILPYEWLTPDELKPHVRTEPILVFWLNDRNFQTHPLVEVGHLIHQLRVTTQSIESAGRPPSFRFQLIGPIDSNSLIAMGHDVKALREKEQTKDATALKQALQGLTILSPWATYADSFFLSPEESSAPNTQLCSMPQHSQSRLTRQFCQLDITLRRTILTDADLARALVEEMFRRGWRTKKKESDSTPQDHLVLIAEWDTPYARVLPLTLAAAFNVKKREVTEEELDTHLSAWVKTLQDNTPIEWPEWIHRFSYLRGVDGKSFEPTERANENPDASEQKTGPGPSFLFGVAHRKRPEGTSQFDYMRRLAEHIDRIKSDLRSECTFFLRLLDQCPEVKAIGVLGSDVYDKLVVLQALRKQFPSTIFFTTDLDARLLHPHELPWTRNVLIASSYGLSLNPPIQADIPPFRSNYQTAMFYSTLCALEAEVPTFPDMCSSSTRQDDHPRLFEIGKDGAYDLTPYDHASPLHPPRLDAFSKWNRTFASWLFAWGMMGAIIFLLFRILVNQRTTIMEQEGRTHYGAWLGCIGLTMFAGITGCVMWNEWIASEGTGEPLSFVQGISIWPTESLRLLTAVLCLYFLGYCRDAVIANGKEIAARYNLAQSCSSPSAMQQFRESVGQSLKSLCFRQRERLFSESQSAAELWCRYLQLVTAPATLGRCVIPVILFFGLGFILIAMLGRPHVPFRGEFSHHMDTFILLGLSVPLLLLLIFWVGDLTMLTRRFILYLFSQAQSGQTQDLHHNQGQEATSPDHIIITTWAALQLIGNHTAVVGQFLIYPFILVFLMMCSRLMFWDAWDFPLPLTLIFALLLFYLLGCAIMLRRTAHHILQTAIEQIRDRMRTHMNQKHWHTDHLHSMLQDMQSLRNGAFAPVSQHPIIQAFLTLGGLAMLTVAEYFGLF